MARRKKNPPYERPAPFTEQFTISPEQAERIRTNQPTGQMVGTPMRFVATESLANSGKCREVHKEKTSKRNDLVRQVIETRKIALNNASEENCEVREARGKELEKFVRDELGYEPRGRNGKPMGWRQLLTAYRQSLQPARQRRKLPRA